MPKNIPKKEYEEALKLIEKLWDANLDTPRGDKLEVLTTLVEAYEEKAHLIFPSTSCNQVDPGSKLN